MMARTPQPGGKRKIISSLRSAAATRSRPASAWSERHTNTIGSLHRS
jgi:hypothetical protein